MENQLDRTQLLTEIRTSYASLESILSPLDEAQMTTAGVNGEWSIKDILAHLTAWHFHLLNLMYAVKHKQEPILNHDGDKGLDAVNAQFREESKHRQLDEVLRDFRATHKQVVEELEQMPDDELSTSPWPDHNPLRDYVAGNTYEHYAEHMQPIRTWLAKNKSV